MEFGEKLQEFRKRKGLTQEELAAALYVSRTAVSKWESGRGYPSIDSLKTIAAFFSVSVDELLSGRELLAVAETDGRRSMQHVRDVVFGMLDCAAAMLLFLPFFGQRVGDAVHGVSLIALTESMWYMKTLYMAMVFGAVLWGIATLALQNCTAPFWTKGKRPVSVLLSTLSCLLFMASQQPYAAMFTFAFLLIKGILLIKKT